MPVARALQADIRVARTIVATASGTPLPDALRGSLVLLIPLPVWQSAVNASVTTVNNSVNVRPVGIIFRTTADGSQIGT